MEEEICKAKGGRGRGAWKCTRKVKPHGARGYCPAHYQFIRKYGKDAKQNLRPVKDYERHDKTFDGF